MSIERPEVTVLMPVFDGGALLAPAVQSVLDQTFRNVELLVVDDGSTDGSSEVLDVFSRQDPRVRIVRHEKNLGLVASLNHGLETARAPLVARLDADDTARSTRVERQVRLFESQPDLVLVATSYRRVAPDGSLRRVGRPPCGHGEFVGAMLDGNRICHSTTMFRRAAALSVGGYRSEWFPVEDYDLWLRLVSEGRYSSVDTDEVTYLDNPSGISSTRAALQDELHRRRASEELARWSGVAPGALQSDRARIRALRRAYAALRHDLVARGIDTAGLASAVHSCMMSATRHRSYGKRHALVSTVAPGVVAASVLGRQRGERRT